MDIRSKIKFSYNYLRDHGLGNLFLLLFFKIQNQRVKLAKKYIKGVGIEIGAGGNPLKVDKHIASVKYVDYLPNKSLQEINASFKKYKTVPIDYVCDANDLSSLGADSQNFIIANHVFEHLRNPIQSLISRYSILKKNGIVFLTVPDMRKTFDKHRNVTTLEHMVDDYQNPSTKKDFEHFLEFAQISLEDKSRLKLFSKDDLEMEAEHLIKINYSIHYHVFLQETVESVVKYGNDHALFNFKIIDKKSTTRNPVDNEFILILVKQ